MTSPMRVLTRLASSLCALMAMTRPAWAGAAPEMDAGTAGTAVALLATASVLILERRGRRRS